MTHRRPNGWLVLIAVASMCHTAMTDEVTWPSVNAGITAAFPSVKQLSTAALAAWLADDRRPAPLLLDVRTAAEYNVSHLRNARLAPTLNAAREVLTGVDKDRSIVVYCSVGYRSAKLAAELDRLGYTHVLNLKGSIFQWRNEGRPVFSNGKPTPFVHPYDARWGRLLKAEYRFTPDD